MPHELRRNCHTVFHSSHGRGTGLRRVEEEPNLSPQRRRRQPDDGQSEPVGRRAEAEFCRGGLRRCGGATGRCRLDPGTLVALGGCLCRL